MNVLQHHKRVSKKLAIHIKFIGERQIQLSILLGDSTNLREGLALSAPKLEITAKNWRSKITILKAEAVHIQA
jgi:hypothetical protein